MIKKSIKLVSLGLTLTFIDVSTVLATNVKGIISSNTTWSEGNSPCVLTEPLLIESGVTLKIEAGVEVKCETNSVISIQK